MRILLGFVVALYVAQGVAGAPVDFDEGKKIARAVYADHPVSLYCGYHINWTKGTSGVLDMPGYQVRKNPSRAIRVEYEHIMPAHNFGQHLACWRKGGRKACQADPGFTKIEADPHNLAPASGEVNGDRSNFRYGVVTSNNYWSYGSCAMKIDNQQRIAEPPDAVKGDVARVYFYMRDTYGINLSSAQEKLYAAWSKADPVDAWETERDRRITRFIGRSNPYVSKQLNADGLGAGPAQERVGSEAESTDLPVYGNTRSKIAHAPGCANYEAVKNSSASVMFDSADNAVAAGYRMAKNCSH